MSRNLVGTHGIEWFGGFARFWEVVWGGGCWALSILSWQMWNYTELQGKIAYFTL